MKVFKYYALFSVLFLTQIVKATSPDLVLNENYNGYTLTTLADSIFSKYSVKLFINPKWADSILIKQASGNNSLGDILKNSFENKNTYFYWNNSKQLIVTRNRSIQTDLSTKSLAVFQQEMQTLSVEEVKEEVQSNGADQRNKTIVIGNPTLVSVPGKANISGFVKDPDTGEPVAGAIVYVEDLQLGIATDYNGFYTVNIPKGKHQLSFKMLGKEDEPRQIQVYSDGKLNVDLKDKLIKLREVTITADKQKNVSGIQMGMEKMDTKTVKQLPALMGEADLLKAALFIPGVQTVGEGASGFNVRGGSTDQNLILYNQAPIFNTSHLFGFFSAFNPDVVNDFQLYKSGIPAQYGGRISSIMDISSKTGNRKEFAVNGGISPITGRLTIEGPIIKDKVSFIIGARSTYSDWVLKQTLIPVTDVLKKSKASFYDLNAKITAEINKNNTIEISTYYSSDFFKLRSDTSYNYTNSASTFTWRHVFGPKLISNITMVNSGYSYDIQSPKPVDKAFKMLYNIGYNEAKLDFSYFPIEKHRIKFGGNFIYYALSPGQQTALGAKSIIKSDTLANEKATEMSFYIGDEWDISNDLTLYAGMRYTIFNALGPKVYNLYTPNVPKDLSTITNVNSIGNNKSVKTYQGFEPRVSLRYKLTERSSVKLSYNRLFQYLHMMSNTTAVSPTDIWKLSDYHLTPQMGDQIAMGYYQDLFQDIETSVEVYYKKLTDILDYKGGAKLTMNHNIETELLRGEGKAYGVELLIKKKMGQLNGWIGYTYSRVQHKISGSTAVESINQGEWFPANYDKPHDFNIIVNYKFTRRFNISANTTYSTGRPITLPVAKYRYSGYDLIYYSNRNEFRVPDYFRVDIAATLEGNLKVNKLAHSSLTLSLYNVLARKNVYSIYFVSNKDGGIQGYKMSVFGSVIPTLTYNFKF